MDGLSRILPNTAARVGFSCDFLTTGKSRGRMYVQYIQRYNMVSYIQVYDFFGGGAVSVPRATSCVQQYIR